MAGRRGTMDSTASSENLDTFGEDDDDHFKPVVRFFQSPGEDLLVQENKDDPRTRRQSVAQLQRIQNTSVGMLPSAMAKARRRSSIHRPNLQYSSPDFQAELEKHEWDTPQSHGIDDVEAQLELDHLKRPEMIEEPDMKDDIDYDKPPLGPAEKEEFFRFGGPVTLADLKEEMGQFCTFESVKRKIPIIQRIQDYKKEDIVGDIVAGLTVGLAVIPGCLAYASIADVNLKYGLYSAFLGPLVYALLGTSKDVTCAVGPTAILSLLTGAFIRRDVGDPGEWAALLCFFAGCVQLAMGFLRLGFLINFLSTPVVSGFTQAAVIVIILSQVKNLMGIKFGSAKDNAVQTLLGYFRKAVDTNGWDVLLGILCITFLLVMKEVKWPAWKPRAGSTEKRPPKWWIFAQQTVRMMSVCRYAICVVVATLAVYLLQQRNINVISATGKLDAGLPVPKLPNFAVGGLAFDEVMGSFGAGLALVPLLATMESIAVAKTFANRFRYNIFTTQEFIALGAVNIVSSFFGSIPVTGAFTRTALAAESGVRTPLAGFVTGGFVIVAIVSLSSMMQYIPKAAMAAVVICSCLIMFDFQIFRELWHIRKSELFVLVFTMIACLLLRAEYGLLMGLTLSILMLVYPMARPIVLVSRKTREGIIDKNLESYQITVTPQSSVVFPAAEFMKEIFEDNLFSETVKAQCAPRLSMVTRDGGPRRLGQTEMRETLPPILFDGIHLTTSDYSTLRALRSVYVNCKATHRELRFTNTSKDILNIIIPPQIPPRVRRPKQAKGEIGANGKAEGVQKEKLLQDE